MLLTLIVSAPLMAQRRNSKDAVKEDYNPKPASQEEYAAFNAINGETDSAKKVALGDQFLTTYPNSQLIGLVQRIRMDSLLAQRKYKEAAAAGEAGLNLETKYMQDLIAKADEQEQAKMEKKKLDK